MVVLIGGESCTGKTLLAQKLLEKTGISYLSIDHLKMGLIRGTENCPFSAEDADNAITPYLWPIVRGIILTNLENRQNIIIEGCYIPPDALGDLPPEWRAEVIILFLGFSEDYIRKNYAAIIQERCAIERRQYEETRSVEELIRQHQEVKVLCAAKQTPYFEIQENYTLEMRKVLDWLASQLAEKS